MTKIFVPRLSNLNNLKRTALLFIVCMAVGCTQSAETTPSKSTAASNQTQAAVVLPAGFPTDAPVFPNSRLVDTTLITSSKSFALTYSLDKSKGTTKQVIDFYSAELTKQGWKIAEAPILNEATGNYIMSAKKDSKEFRVTTYPLPQQNNDISINLNLAGYSK
jgi:hypothetical protein